MLKTKFAKPLAIFLIIGAISLICTLVIDVCFECLSVQSNLQPLSSSTNFPVILEDVEMDYPLQTPEPTAEVVTAETTRVVRPDVKIKLCVQEKLFEFIMQAAYDGLQEVGVDVDLVQDFNVSDTESIFVTPLAPFIGWIKNKQFSKRYVPFLRCPHLDRIQLGAAKYGKHCKGKILVNIRIGVKFLGTIFAMHWKFGITLH